MEQLASEAEGKGHDFQADALSDGEVTLAEYDEAHRRGLACLTDAGLTHSEPVRNRVDGFRWTYDVSWEGMSDADGNAAYEACFNDSLGEIELAMASWGEYNTDAALLAATEECVADTGIVVDREGIHNHRELLLAGADQGLTMEVVLNCVQMSAERLYPTEDYVLTF
ncbi:hypothetical protein [Demequina sediminicola]|uniref:hypothetical protein n=1 Tax=Demequina sediminicola TaxID=1095026 RepID=UPI000783C59A|nr:hypothetical protein [Demequina sediminicola]